MGTSHTPSSILCSPVWNVKYTLYKQQSSFLPFLNILLYQINLCWLNKTRKHISNFLPSNLMQNLPTELNFLLGKFVPFVTVNLSYNSRLFTFLWLHVAARARKMWWLDTFEMHFWRLSRSLLFPLMISCWPLRYQWILSK